MRGLPCGQFQPAFVQGILELGEGPRAHAVHPGKGTATKRHHLFEGLDAGVGEGPAGGSRDPPWQRGTAGFNGFRCHVECLPVDVPQN